MIPSRLLPSDLVAFIAGGFAACPALATDVDIWISTAVGSLDHTRQRILDHLQVHGFAYTEQDGEGSPRQTFQGLKAGQLLSTFAGYHMYLAIRHVATVLIEGASLPYHLIVIEGDVNETLSSFDISTHQIALTDKGVVKGEHWTPLWETPQVIQSKYTTPERLKKITERYRSAWNVSDVAETCAPLQTDQQMQHAHAQRARRPTGPVLFVS